MRVGAAQDLLALNMELPSVMQAGRWADTRMPTRYGENVLLSRLRHIPRSPSCRERVMRATRPDSTRPDSATRRSDAEIAAI